MERHFDYQITVNGKPYQIVGSFGAFCVYHGAYCIAFDVMTASDAENCAASHAENCR